jgi:hypothetical protein
LYHLDRNCGLLKDILLSPPAIKKRDRSILAEPVAKRLFFAGEATSKEYPATVARFSGGN